MSLTEYFWARVARAGADACWPWTGPLDDDGYGKASVKRRTKRANRVAWELARGPIPEGLLVCHNCDNPPCCNPAHLFLDTNAGNMADRNSKGRQVKGDRTTWRRFPERIGEISGDNSPSRRHPERLARGEANGNSVLSDQQVAEIRSTDVSARGARAALARRFGVNKTTIGRILKGSRRAPAVATSVDEALAAVERARRLEGGEP